MKAAKQWEEENWLRLIYLANRIFLILNKTTKSALIAVNVLLYLAYQTAKGLLLILKLLFLTENSLKRIERDETWIFRQIK